MSLTRRQLVAALKRKDYAAVLKDTVDFYSEDTTRRSMGADKVCMYFGPNGRRCAVGRLLPKSKQEFVSEDCGAASLNTPELNEYGITTDNVEFLSSIQGLHDRSVYWNENGLTLKGKKCVKRMKKEFTI